MRTPSCSASVLMSDTRAIESECTSAARLKLTNEAICWAVCTALGSNSSALNVWSQATILPMSNSESRKNVRQNSERPRRGRISSGAGAVSSGAGPVTSMLLVTARINYLSPAHLPQPRLSFARCRAGPSTRAVRNKYVAYTPHRLDIARGGRIGLHQFAQARHLHVQAAVERLELASTCQLGQLFARQRLARVPHQRLEHREFAGGQRQLLAVLAQGARSQIERERPEGDHFVVARRCARRFLSWTAPQHGVDTGQQFARIERLAQVIVGADLQPDDPIHVLAFGREHDDGRAVIGRPQAAADRKSVFARHHEVEYDQVGRFAQHEAVQGFPVLGQDDLESFLGQIAAQEVADSGVIVDDEDLVGTGYSLCHVGPGGFVTEPILRGLTAGRVHLPLTLTQCYKCCPPAQALTCRV